MLFFSGKTKRVFRRLCSSQWPKKVNEPERIALTSNVLGIHRQPVWHRHLQMHCKIVRQFKGGGGGGASMLAGLLIAFCG